MHHYEHFWLNPTFWVAVSFVIFVALAAKMVWGKATEALDARADKTRAELDEAARLRAEAEAMRRQAETDRAAALAEGEALIARAKAEAERLSASTAAEAEAAAGRRERMAMERIQAAESGALAEVRQAAASIAAAAAREVISTHLDAAADARLIDAAVADLPRALRAALSGPTGQVSRRGPRGPFFASAAWRQAAPPGARNSCPLACAPAQRRRCSRPGKAAHRP